MLVKQEENISVRDRTDLGSGELVILRKDMDSKKIENGVYSSEVDARDIKYGSESKRAEDRELIAIYKATKPGEGMFVSARIGKTELSFLVDTGASCTIVSEDIFRELKKLPEAGEGFNESRKLQAADGSFLKVLGKLKLPVKLGKVVVQHEVIDAKITDSGILGYDFLKQHKLILILIEGN